MLENGFLNFPLWGVVLFVLGLTQITIASVTIFLHRCQAHRSLTLHPVMSHFFRFWLWLTTAIVTREWTAIHRKHHAKAETEEDPHSPHFIGIFRMIFVGVLYYVRESKNSETIERYGYGTPNDWLEKNLYSRFSFAGVALMLVIDIMLFGFLSGVIIWAIQMVWIPFWASGIINGVGHYWGYRNFQPQDESRNIVPLGIFIGGEELHNNHHAFPTSARLSNRWYEFDIGWFYIRLMEMLGLAKVKRVAPKLLSSDSLANCDLDTLQSIITNRLEVTTRFIRSIRKTSEEEWRTHIKQNGALRYQTLHDWLNGMERRLSDLDKKHIGEFIKQSKTMGKIVKMRQELESLWNDKNAQTEQLIKRLREWCIIAEKSGINDLAFFAQSLRGFSTAKE